jgi:hypothetical protein
MGTEPINLADPDFEASDEQFAELLRRAFADVGAANESALATFWQEIAARSSDILREMAARRSSPPQVLP